MKKLNDKVAFISAGTAGIGLATARVLIDHVIFTGRYPETVSKTEQELGSAAKGIVSNASNMRDVMELKERVSNMAPKIDILFANAGYGKFAPVEAVTEEQFDELFDVLVKGTFFTIQQLLPLINEGGSVILNTSVVTAYGSKNACLYSAAKASVQSMIKTLAAELTERRIRVNGVSPGYTETQGFSKTGMSEDQIKEVKAYIRPNLPYKRFADASEIANVVSFLASDEASYLHATEIVTDGGFATIR